MRNGTEAVPYSAPRRNGTEAVPTARKGSPPERASSRGRVPAPLSQETAMPDRIRRLAARAAASVPTLLTLAALVALACWGRYNNWRLWPSGLGDQQPAADRAPAEQGVNVLAASSSGPARIEFPSAA